MSQIEPLVSIILPTYNRAHLIPYAINSILAQTYHNWELIIWIDGATDNTREVLNYYDDHRIKIFSDKNQGVSYALNHAISASRSEYVAFLDDDDQWTDHKLSHQMITLLDYPEIDLIFGNFRNINKASGKVGLGFEQNAFAMRYLKYHTVQNNSFLITDNFLKSISINNFIAFDSVIIRKDLIEKAGKFNENLRNGQDFEYWWRLAILGARIAYTTEVVLDRIKYPSSLSSSNLESIKNRISSLDSCLEITKANQRIDLIPYLHHPYRNAWQNIMPVYSETGNFKMLLEAFVKSISFGLNAGSFRLLLKCIVQFLFNGISVSPKSKK